MTTIKRVTRLCMFCMGVLLSVISMQAVAATDGKAVVAEIQHRGDNAVAAYSPDNKLVTATEFSQLYFDVFEGAGMELDLGIKSPELKTDIEILFGLVNGKAMRGVPRHELKATWLQLRDRLQDASVLYAREEAGTFLPVFIQSLLILLREGAEAMLVVAALSAYLRRAGGADRVWVIYVGAMVAIPLAFMTVWALTGVLQASGTSRAVIEGGTMIFAACMLCYVSFWLFSKREARRWQSWVAGQMSTALSGGSLLALAGTSCLAVYREGAETVLFYQALSSAGAGQGYAIASGIAAATALLVIGVLVFRVMTMRIPYHLFFSVTAAMLYAMAVIFMGQGIIELQAIGYLGALHLPGIPQISWLGLAPTAQGAGMQGIILLLPVLAWLYMRRRTVR